MDTNGFYGDTFSSGFGDFYTAKRTPVLVRSGVKETSFPEVENLYSLEPDFAFFAHHKLKVEIVENYSKHRQ